MDSRKGKQISGFPEGTEPDRCLVVPPGLSDICLFMTDCIRPDRTSVADMWTIENVLRLRLYAGEGNKNMLRICFVCGGGE